MRVFTGTKLVIINSLATYARMFLSVGLSLLSSRWILSALGPTDFGLYAVVAGIMGFLTFLTGAMTGSAQRHFAYAIGNGDETAVNLWFNSSLMLHVGLALLMVAIGIPFGQFMLSHVLTIPADRLAVCQLVFLCTLFTVFIHVLSIPFSGMMTAKQRIYELSTFQFAQIALMCGFAYSLPKIPGDRLLAYAVGVTGISLVITGLMVLRCSTAFRECRLGRQNGIETYRRIKELIAFAGWSFFGSLGFVGSNQGMAFLINIFSGPRVNASFGIANQVSGQTAALSQAFFNAVSPEITSSEGRGQRERVVSLALRASKFAVLLTCLLLIPVFLEIDQILALWLKDVPPYTAALCRIVLLGFLVDKLTVGCMVAVTAYGKIAGYQSTLGGTLLFAPLIAWLLFAFGFSVVWAVGCGLLITRTICSIGRVWWMKRLLQVPMQRWFWDVPVKIATTVLLTSGVAVSVRWFMEPSIVRIFTTLSTSFVTLGVTAWFWGLDEPERNYLAVMLQKSVHTLQKAMK